MKLPVRHSEAGYVYDADGNIVCHSSSGHAEEIAEALNRGWVEGRHDWDLISVGMYDSTYSCRRCGERHTLQVDAPERGGLPEKGCW